MYEYEKTPVICTKEYTDTINSIEELRERLKINETRLFSLMDSDLYDSIRIEGNQLTRDEVTLYLSENVTIRGKSLKDHLQARNYDNMLQILKGMVRKGGIVELSDEMICAIHAIVTEGELPPKECGHFRDDAVHIRYTDYIPPGDHEIPFLIAEFVENYNREPEPGETQFERICEFKRNFERIHPFFDGNGRTGRVLMNVLCLQNGYGYIHFPSEERDLYFRSLDDNTFAQYAAKNMLKSMRTIEKNREKLMEVER